MLSVTGRRTPLSAALRSQVDADREVRVQRPVAGNFFPILTVFQLILFVAAIPLLRRARRPAGPITPQPNPPWYEHAVERLLVAAALVVPAALLAGLVPWWRGPPPVCCSARSPSRRSPPPPRPSRGAGSPAGARTARRRRGARRAR